MKTVTVIGILISLLSLTACGGGSGGPSSQTKITSPVTEDVTLSYTNGNGFACFVDQAGINTPGFRVLCYGSALVSSPNSVISVMSSETDYVTSLSASGNTLCVQTRNQIGFCFGDAVSGLAAVPPSQITASESQGITFNLTPTTEGNFQAAGFTAWTGTTACTLNSGLYDCPEAVSGGLADFTLTYGLE